ncbi:MAG: gamma-glutamyltransferase 2 [Gemmatimonadetes bacterium]|nr:gamma-glutamyltransferase 2 [Gemmatimonadota bacterium]
MHLRTLPLASAAALLAISAAGAAAQQNAMTAADSAVPLPVPGRSVVTTRYGIVASSQPLAAAVGAHVLERGGNAVDAAIATNAVVGVMEPTGNGLGGDMFALVYEARTGRVYGLNASGWAASGMTPQMLASKGVTALPERGVWTVTVPGVVAGWDAMRQRFGTKPFSELLAPAIWYADHGFPVAEVTAGLWARSQAFLAGQPNAAHTYLIDGRTPRAGQVFRNPDLAGSLRRVAQHGRAGLYEGPTADAIVRIVHEQGGTMTEADLAEFRAEWVEPISTTYRGWRVYEIPPNGQGIAALSMLNLMERFPLAQYGFHSARALHVMMEAKKLAYADMLRYVGDPRFGPVPVAQMLDKERAARRAALIDPARAACSVEPMEIDGITNAKGNETIYMTVIDREGNIVSLIQSNYSGFGSGLVPAGAGFMLQNRGALFTLRPGQPNTLAPRKRPLHTIIPAFMEKDGTRIGFGIMGGWNQAQAHAQFVADVADFGMSIQQALEAGRFTKGTFEGCDVEIEETVPAATRAALTAMGHQLTVRTRRTPNFGYGQAVMSDSAGVHFGASDPRHDGQAVPETPPVFAPAAAPASPAPVRHP